MPRCAPFENVVTHIPPQWTAQPACFVMMQGMGNCETLHAFIHDVNKCQAKFCAQNNAAHPPFKAYGQRNALKSHAGPKIKKLWTPRATQMHFDLAGFGQANMQRMFRKCIHHSVLSERKKFLAAGMGRTESIALPQTHNP
eukprot:1161664-Pelagomonas_calceolata.AAC.2